MANYECQELTDAAKLMFRPIKMAWQPFPCLIFKVNQKIPLLNNLALLIFRHVRQAGFQRISRGPYWKGVGLASRKISLQSSGMEKGIQRFFREATSQHRHHGRIPDFWIKVHRSGTEWNSKEKKRLPDLEQVNWICNQFLSKQGKNTWSEIIIKHPVVQAQDIQQVSLHQDYSFHPYLSQECLPSFQ